MTKNMKKIILLVMALVMIVTTICLTTFMWSSTDNYVGGDKGYDRVASGRTGVNVGANGNVETNYNKGEGIAISNATQLVDFLTSASSGNQVKGYLTADINNFVFNDKNYNNAPFNNNIVKNMTLDGQGYKIQLTATSLKGDTHDWSPSVYLPGESFAQGTPVVCFGGFAGVAENVTIKNTNFVFDGKLRIDGDIYDHSVLAGAIFGYMYNSTMDNCSLFMDKGALYFNTRSNTDDVTSAKNTTLIAGYAGLISKTTISNSLIDMGDPLGALSPENYMKLYAARNNGVRENGTRGSSRHARAYAGGITGMLNREAKIYNITTAGTAGIQAGVYNNKAMSIAGAGIVAGVNSNDPWLTGVGATSASGLGAAQMNKCGAGTIDGVINGWIGRASWNASYAYREGAGDGKTAPPKLGNEAAMTANNKEYYMLTGCVVALTGSVNLDANGKFDSFPSTPNSLLSGVFYTYDTSKDNTALIPPTKKLGDGSYVYSDYMHNLFYADNTGATQANTKSTAYGFSPVGGCTISNQKPDVIDNDKNSHEPHTKTINVRFPYSSILTSSQTDANSPEYVYNGNNAQANSAILKFSSTQQNAKLVVEYIPPQGFNMVWEYDIVDKANSLIETKKIKVYEDSKSMQDILDVPQNGFNNKSAFQQTYERENISAGQIIRSYKFVPGKVVSYKVKGNTTVAKEYDGKYFTPTLNLYLDINSQNQWKELTDESIWLAARPGDNGVETALKQTYVVPIKDNKPTDWQLYVWNNNSNSKYEFISNSERYVSYRLDKREDITNTPSEFVKVIVSPKKATVNYVVGENQEVRDNEGNLIAKGFTQLPYFGQTNPAYHKYVYNTFSVQWKASVKADNLITVDNVIDSCDAELAFFDGDGNKLDRRPQDTGKYKMKVVSLTNANYTAINDLYYEFEITQREITVNKDNVPGGDVIPAYSYDELEHKVPISYRYSSGQDFDGIKISNIPYANSSAITVDYIRDGKATNDFKNAGLYSIVIKSSNSNYSIKRANNEGAYVVDVPIVPAEVKIYYGENSNISELNSVTYSGNNYDLSLITARAFINGKQINVELDNHEITKKGKDGSFAPAIDTIEAGQYKVTVSVRKSNTNFQQVSKVFTFIIEQKEVFFDFGYGVTNKQINIDFSGEKTTYTATVNGLLTWDINNLNQKITGYKYLYSPTAFGDANQIELKDKEKFVRNAGFYTIIAENNFIDSYKYSSGSDRLKVTVNQQTINIKAGSLTYTYGDGDPDLTGKWTYNGESTFHADDEVSVILKTEAKQYSYAGTYEIEFKELSGKDKFNYKIVCTNGIATVLHKQINFDFTMNRTAVEGNYVYNGENLTAKSEFDSEKNFEVTYTYEQGNTSGIKNVGTYTVNAKLTDNAALMFVFKDGSTTSKNVKIVPKNLIVDVNQFKIAYGTDFVSDNMVYKTDYDFAEGYAPFSGDLDSVKNSLVFSTNRTIWDNAGQQFAMSIGVKTELSNYTLEIRGMLTVTKAPLTVKSITNPSSLVYNGQAKLVVVALEGVLNQDEVNIRVEYYYNGSIVSAINVGYYDIKVVGTYNDNYYIVENDNNSTVFEITPLQLTINLGDYTREYGSSVINYTGDKFEYVGENKILDDDNDNVVVELVDETNVNDVVGSYNEKISAKMQGIGAGNYSLTINRKGNLTIIALDLSKVKLATEEVTYEAGKDWASEIKLEGVRDEFLEMVAEQTTIKFNGAVVKSIIIAGTYTISIVNGDNPAMSGEANLQFVVKKADRTLDTTGLSVIVNYNKLTFNRPDGLNVKFGLNNGEWSTDTLSVKAATDYTVYAYLVGDENYNDSKIVKIGDYKTGFDVDTINTALAEIGDKFALEDIAKLANIEEMLKKVEEGDMKFVNSTKLTQARAGKEELIKAVQNVVKDAQGIASKTAGRSVAGVAVVLSIGMVGIALILSKKRFGL